MNTSRCWIGMGGNLGDVDARFDEALRRLKGEPGIQVNRESRRFETAPIGGKSKEHLRYLNSVVEVTYAHSLLSLLDVLQGIELELGRERSEYWGSRTIDLDLLLHEQQQWEDSRLLVPHPHMWYRRFVLDPLVELAGEIRHPARGLCIKELRSRLLVRPFPCRLFGGETQQRCEIIQRLRETFGEAAIQACEGDLTSPMNGDSGLCLWLGNKEGTADLESLPAVNRLDLGIIRLPASDAAEQVLQAALNL